MRTTWLAATLGTILVVLDVAGAIGIGPDDWLDSPPQLVNPGGEVALVTNYGLLSQSFPLRISASAQRGDVFVGVGHAVDVDDYVAATATAQLGWFSPYGLISEPRTAQNPSLPAAPTGVDFWTARVSGSGTQTLVGNFAGLPVEAVVTTANGEAGDLRVSIGSQLAGAFVGSLAAIGLGSALLAFGGWRGWRDLRRHRTDTKAEPSASPPTTRGRRVWRQAATPVLSWALVLAGTGCTAQPVGIGHVPITPRAALTRNPLDGLDLAAVAADYDRRNNPAIAAAAAPRYSATEWTQADGELVLASDRFITAWDRVLKRKETHRPCRTTYGAAFPGIAVSSYPMTIMVTVGMTCEPGVDPAQDDIAVLSRSHSYSAWLLVAEVPAGKLTPPTPDASVPSTDEAPAANDAAAGLVRYLNVGKTELVLPADLTKWRTQRLRASRWSTSTWSAAVLPRGIRLGRSEAGTVAVVSLLITQTTTAKTGASVGWKSPWNRVYQQTGSYHRTSERFGLFVAVLVRDGQVSISDWSSANYLQS
jgi:hypothetical protein